MIATSGHRIFIHHHLCVHRLLSDFRSLSNRYTFRNQEVARLGELVSYDLWWQSYPEFLLGHYSPFCQSRVGRGYQPLIEPTYHLSSVQTQKKKIESNFTQYVTNGLIFSPELIRVNLTSASQLNVYSIDRPLPKTRTGVVFQLVLFSRIQSDPIRF